MNIAIDLLKRAPLSISFPIDFVGQAKYHVLHLEENYVLFPQIWLLNPPE